MTETGEPTVMTHDDGPVRVLTLNRPRVKNAIDMPLRVELAECLEAAMAADEVRAVVITGAGGAFCSGGDIATMHRQAPELTRPRAQAAQRVVRAIWNGAKPVVAAVEGPALGAGLALALACDRIVAATDAQFGAAFANVGLAGDMGIFATLPARIGAAAAKQMLMLPGRIAATTAFELGLIDSVVEPSGALTSALADAHRLAAGPPLALAAIKSLLSQSATDRFEILDREVETQAQLFDTEDFAEGVAAFGDRRTPEFRGPLMLTTSYWPKDESVPLVDFTVGGLLAQRAAEQPDSPALIATEHGSGAARLMTYGELYERAMRVASALAPLTEPGEAVALWAPNVAEWPVIQYGAALADVVLVALNPALRAAELTYALTHSKAAVLIHADRSRDYDMAVVAGAVRHDCPALRTVISLSEAERWEADNIDSEIDRRSPTDPDAPVMLQYTSGTTGKPKGVLLRHRSLVNVAKLTLEAVGVPRGASSVNPLPMFHTAGCVISTLGPLWVGGKVVLVEQFDPCAVLATMHRERADVLFFVPTILGALLAAQAASEEQAPRLHTILGGASVVPPAMVEAAERTFGASVINVFGQTELAPVLTATRPDDPHREHLHTVGRPLPHVDCAILDPATGVVQPLGESGEICARGYQQLICYLDDPEATAATVDADGFVHTGDLGSMDGAGYITLTGRLKELIIRGGENISPVEIEACLLEHQDVADAAVVGVGDERLGERVVAIVTPAGDPQPGLAERLTAHCRTHLAPHKTPSAWYRLDVLPRTPTGKVQKFRLADLLDRDECPHLP